VKNFLSSNALQPTKNRNKVKKGSLAPLIYALRNGFPQRRQFALERLVMQWQVGHMVCD
jgi:hypothetical protein